MHEAHRAVVLIVPGGKKGTDLHLLHARHKARRRNIALGDDERDGISDRHAEKTREVFAENDVKAAFGKRGKPFFSDGLREFTHLGFFRGINAAHK